MKCSHELVETSRSNYFDYSGFRVLKVAYRCSRCGKRIVRKFWRVHKLSVDTNEAHGWKSS